MRLPLIYCAIVLLVFASGCRLFSEEAGPVGQSPLKPARMSPDSVTMEIVWARYPFGDPQLNDEVWQEIDETQLEPSVKLALAENGFRAGVISGAPPAPIARALRMGESSGTKQSEVGAAQSIDVLVEPTIRGHVKQMRRKQRHEIQASEVYASMPLLVKEGRELRGRTYKAAQPVYALEVDPQPNRMVMVELTPELHFGPAQMRWTGDEGVMRTVSMREREIFERLRMRVRLGPGDTLVLMSLPEAASRLGYYFHTTEGAEGRQQKLILIRVAQLPSSDTFAGR